MKAKSKRKKKGKKIILVIILLILIVGGIGLYKASKQPIDITPTVQTQKATRGDLQEELTNTGNVAGMETVAIYAPAAGTIQEVSFRVGDEIQGGTVLATYDMEKMEKDLYQAKLQNEKAQISYDHTVSSSSKGNGKVKEADTNLSVLKQQLEDHQNYLKNLQKELVDYQTKVSNDLVLANYNLTKKQAEFKTKLADLTPGTKEYEEAVKELENIANQLEQLTLAQRLNTQSDYEKDLEKKISEEQRTIADLQEYQAKMQSQKTTGEASVLDADNRRQLEIDKELTDMSYQTLLEEAELAKKGVVVDTQGIITNLMVRPGSQVAAGMQLAELERSDMLKVKATATKYAMERLKLGQRVDVTLGDKTFEGKVAHIDKIAVLNSFNAASVGFEVELLEKDDTIYIGMEAKMKIYTNKAENTLILPSEAVNANKDGDFVYVVQNGAITKKPVKVGIICNGQTEIKEGITENDEVVVKYSGYLEEGTIVNSTPAQSQ